MTIEQTTVICDARAHACHCVREPGHEPPHRCVDECGGSWTGTFGEDDFAVVSWPITTVASGFADSPSVIGLLGLGGALLGLGWYEDDEAEEP